MKLAAAVACVVLMAAGPASIPGPITVVDKDTVPAAIKADTARVHLMNYEFTQQQLMWTYQAFDYAKNMPLMRHDIRADSAAQQMLFYVKWMQSAVNVVRGWQIADTIATHKLKKKR